MSQLLTACPICSATSFEPFLSCKDYTVSQETFQLQRCISCDFVFTNPRPDEAEIGKYYKSDDYISHTNSSKGALNKVYQWVREKTIATKLSIVEEKGPLPKAILDYGCGTGEFLAAAKNSGWLPQGLELDPDARGQAILNHGLNVQDPSHLKDFTEGQFGVITLWHVLEHVHDLKNVITHFHRVLSSAGVLIIAVPNRKSFDAQHYKEYWAAYDVPRHLYHFTRQNIAQLMDNEGFKLEETRSLFFDPFYISLLSEKYKNGWQNPVSAGINGLRTTLNGKSNIDANSSLLYILRKK